MKSRESVALPQNPKVRESEQGRASDYTVRTESERIEAVDEQTHILLEPRVGMEDVGGNWIDVEDPRDKVISNLWQEKDWLVRDRNKLRMKVRETDSRLALKQTVHRAIFAELERVETEMERLQAGTDLLLRPTDRMPQRPARSEGRERMWSGNLI